MSCKKTYNPAVTTVNYNYLVIEGIINTGQDSTIITLSRTIPIQNKAAANPELNAQVTIENDQNKIYTLKETGNGKYALPPLNLDNTRQYRLRIKTSDNQEYLSDFVQAQISPPIDSVTFAFNGSAENIYSYTHDAPNNSRYYRWEYTETYLFFSQLTTNYIFNGHNIVLSTPATQEYICYISDTSSTVILNSSAKLTQNVINKNPVTQVSILLDKLKVRYSILVKQYTLTPSAYTFYQSLAKNTENLGSIFDAQPSELIGNIHCTTTPSQPVLGYISAGTVTQKRIFIDRAVIPTGFIGIDYSYCGVAIDNWKGDRFPLPSNITRQDAAPLDSITAGYDKSTHDSLFMVPFGDPTCVNCRIRGSNQKPAFWQ